MVDTGTRWKRIAYVVLVSLLATSIGVVPAAAGRKILPVPRVTIYPGDDIAARLIVEKSFSDRAVRRLAVFDSAPPLIGKIARRTLLPGQPIPLNAVRERDLVIRGIATLVVFRAGGLEITTHAVPLRSGSAGDAVQLRNRDSGVIFSGTVLADGTIRVGQP